MKNDTLKTAALWVGITAGALLAVLLVLLIFLVARGGPW